MNESRILNLQEAAEFLSISDRLLRRLVNEKKLFARKVGREWRFHKDNLEEFVKGTHKVKSSK